MTASPSDPSDGRRGPRVFRPDDPTLVLSSAGPDDDARRTRPPGAADQPASASMSPTASGAANAGILEAGFHWGLLFVSALAGAASLAAGLWFARLVSIGFERDDWIGLALRGLVALAALAGLMIILRELIGLRRLTRLGKLRKDVDRALAGKDQKAERRAADRILALYRGRHELAWALDRVRTHRGDVHDAGALLVLVERDLVAGLDGEARRQITTAAKRVATVTAMSPMTSIALGFVVFENLRLLRRLAANYGGRPGLAGALRLSRSVIGNLIAAGGLALTDDLLGQFIGQDVLRRLSRRLGEGAFNGALTARIGVATLREVRPLPFLEAEPLRVRDILAEVVRPSATTVEPSPSGRSARNPD